MANKPRVWTSFTGMLAAIKHAKDWNIIQFDHIFVFNCTRPHVFCPDPSIEWEYFKWAKEGWLFENKAAIFEHVLKTLATAELSSGVLFRPLDSKSFEDRWSGILTFFASIDQRLPNADIKCLAEFGGLLKKEGFPL